MIQGNNAENIGRVIAASFTAIIPANLSLGGHLEGAIITTMEKVSDPEVPPQPDGTLQYYLMENGRKVLKDPPLLNGQPMTEEQLQEWGPWLNRQRGVMMAGAWQQPWMKNLNSRLFNFTCFCPLEPYWVGKYRGWHVPLAPDSYKLATIRFTATANGPCEWDLTPAGVPSLMYKSVPSLNIGEDLIGDVIVDAVEIGETQPIAPLDLNADRSYTIEDIYLRLQQALAHGEIINPQVVTDLQFLLENQGESA